MLEVEIVVRGTAADQYIFSYTWNFYRNLDPLSLSDLIGYLSPLRRSRSFRSASISLRNGSDGFFFGYETAPEAELSFESIGFFLELDPIVAKSLFSLDITALDKLFETIEEKQHIHRQDPLIAKLHKVHPSIIKPEF